jgi:hypothetical protein
VSVADHQARHLQGTSGPVITVPAGATEFAYPVFLPPWMETGRTSRTCVMAVGIVKDPDGKEHTVSFTSVQTNEQIVVVIEPGRLGVALDRNSVRATPGKTVFWPVQIARGKSLQGPAKIELILPGHWRGIGAEPVVVPAGQATARLTIRFAPEVKGPFNAPAIIRATIMENGKPVVGEIRLEIIPPMAR